ncbi:MAG TPA: matrixin family metalloprotease [Myxococcota bacterium]
MRCRIPSSALVASVVAFTSLSAPAAAFDEAFKLIENGSIWNVANPITFVLDPTGSDDLPDDDSELDAIRAAFRAWQCVPGVKLPFDEQPGPGPRVMDLNDNQNTLFWDESGEDCGMGPGTLGITVGPVNGGFKTNTDICFNGKDHEWGVGRNTDVQSIALHEIGHWLGLDHPCDNDQDTTSCLPVTDALMFPQWSGANDREPLKSDIAGVQHLYPLPDGEDPFCQAPFNEFERCACSEECVEGLLCIPDAVGELRCGSPCSTSDSDCGGGACIIDTPTDGGGTGVCVRIAGRRPNGAVCANGIECESGNCGAIIALGRSVCLFQCSADADCDGGSCFDGYCLGNVTAVSCPVEGGCGCANGTCEPTTSSSTSAGVALSTAVAGLWVLRRRRRG